MSKNVHEVFFKVKCNLNFGEEIRLVGNVAVLGLNQPRNAIPLVTNSDDYPEWTTRSAIIVRKSLETIRYRYCVFSGGKFVGWDVVGNRSLDKSRFVQGVYYVDDIIDNPKSGIDMENGTEDEDDVPTIIQPRKDDCHNGNELMQCDLSDGDTVLHVSYVLPVKLLKSEAGQWSTKWDSEHMLSFTYCRDVQTLYVGTIRYNNMCISEVDQPAVSTALRALNCHPVFLDDVTHDQFYLEFCELHQKQIFHEKKNVFAPLSQLMEDTTKYKELWCVYYRVLVMFRDKMLEIYHHGYLIWILGYHLMMLPSVVRHKIPTARIGYFFDCPFPMSDTWMSLYMRKELLRGMTAANQVGFDLFTYAQHFTSTCCRLLGYTYYTDHRGVLVLDVDGREVTITCMHRGIDIPPIVKTCATSRFIQTVEKWRQRYAGKKLVTGIVNSLEHLKGLSIKFLEIEHLLTENPQYVQNVVFLVIGVPPLRDYRQNVHYSNLEVAGCVERINTLFGTDVCIYEECTVEQVQLSARLALFAATDILLITAVPLDVNVYPFEYILARQQIAQLESSPGQPFVPPRSLMVLSKYQSSASVLESAIKVNPRALGETKDALKYALDAKVEDIKESLYTDLSFITRHTLPVWAHIMLSDLKGASGNNTPRETKYSVGLSSELSTRNFGAGFESLMPTELYKSYRNTHKRLIVFSGDILYQMHEEQEEQETETDRLHKLPIPEALYINENNLVFVVTRRSKEIIDANFTSTFLGLGAEHGFYCRWPADKLTKDNQIKLAVNGKSITEWQYSQKQNLVSNEWKPQIQNLMEMFCKVTQHTYIEAYEHSLRWHYAAADPEFGFQQSRSMEEYIVKQLALKGVDITRGRTEKERFLEVRTRGVSKGAFLENVLLTMKSIDMQADFVLVIGSDETDEAMFDVANRLTDAPSAPVVYTATVGRYSSNAKMCISSMTEAINLLRGLANSSKKKVTGRTHSYPDLSKISATTSHDQQGGVRQSMSYSSVDSAARTKSGQSDGDDSSLGSIHLHQRR